MTTERHRIREIGRKARALRKTSEISKLPPLWHAFDLRDVMASTFTIRMEFASFADD